MQLSSKPRVVAKLTMPVGHFGVTKCSAFLLAVFLTFVFSANGCTDLRPAGGYSCAQQKSWGKCSQSWMISGGFCISTCGRCQGVRNQLQSSKTTSAAVAAVTFPVYVPAPSVGRNGAVFAQVPFRYEPRIGNPPLTRTGYYYLPSGWRKKALPVMVIFHGLAGFGGVGGGKRIGDVGIMGAGSRINFRQMAEKYQFILIAPDSRSASLSGWRVPLAKEPPTPDVLHAQASLEYVMGLPGVRVDRKHVATAGVSNGGYMAAPVASRYSIYTHAMLFHATFKTNQLQTHKFRIWISTGVRDNQCRASSVIGLAKYFRQLRVFRLWPAITYNVKFRVGHTLEDPLERVGNWQAITSQKQLSAWANAGAGARMAAPALYDASYMGPLNAQV